MHRILILLIPLFFPLTFLESATDKLPLARISHKISSEVGQDVASNSSSYAREHCQVDKARAYGDEDGATDCSNSPRVCVKCGLDAYQYTYPYNPYVDIEVWDFLAPHFLPEDHPIKQELDTIFSSKKRVIKTKKSLKKAKFKIIREGKYRHPYVVSHSRIQGYLLKLYTDKQAYRNTKGLKFVHRIHGAQYIQEAVDMHGYNSFFKVPKKWIYPLPAEPFPPNKKKHRRRNFILVVEDMDILNKKNNYDMWKSSAITPEKLDAIYTILDEVGLNDSILVFNLPFSNDGKISFIDTEYYHRWPVKFRRLGYYLSPEMKEYWKLLIMSQGPN